MYIKIYFLDILYLQLHFLLRCITGLRVSFYKIWKSYEKTQILKNQFRLFGHAITMTSWFGVTCVRYELVAQLYSFSTVICGHWFDLQW